MRKIFFGTVVAVDTMISASLTVLLSFFPGTEKKIRKVEEYWARIMVFAARLRVHTDLPELDKNSNYIFVCNHQSHLDTPILLSLFKDFQPRFLAKDSLFRIPFLGQGMSKTGHFSVDRHNPRQGMRDMQRAAEYLDEGESLLVFPEGTRSEDGELQDFYTGVFIIALKSANTRVVPLVMEGTRKILPKGKIGIKKNRDVYITGGSPVDVHQEYGLKERDRLKEDMRKLMEQMYSEIGEWKKQKRN